MKQQEILKVFERISVLGLEKFSDEQLQNAFRELNKAIHIGINRTGAPTSEDGGLLAFPTGIEPITADQVQQIPDGTRAITCACGGTNWVFAVATKQADGSMNISEPVIRPIPENQRRHTFQSVVDLIADEITAVATAYDLLQVEKLPIAISFGFPQENIRTVEGDIDARLNRRKLPKFWEITDLDETLPIEQQVSLAGLLRQALTVRGFTSIGSIVFANDTVAVALDVQHSAENGADLPVGFVFGTGTNAAMYGGKKKGIVNLEAGHARVIMRDAVLGVMEQMNMVPTLTGNMEYWMGGGFLPARLAATVLSLSPEFLDAQQVADVILHTSNQAFISEMAQGFSARQFELHIGPFEKQILQECAHRILIQAGQLIGLMIAVVCASSGYTSGLAYVPYEGSLLAKGYLIKETSDETIKSLIPGSDIHPYKASGVVGVAKIAMLKTLTRLG